MICAGLGLALSILAHPLLSRWINSDFANQNTALLQFLTLAYFILGLNIGPHFALFGLGKSNLAASVGIASGIISIIVMAVTLGPLGLFGASLGRLAYGIVALADFYFVWSALKQHGRRVTL
jgi:O-antigen/teichoic acid export membrane protein